MEFLPAVIEDLIYDYKAQIEHSIKMNECLKELDSTLCSKKYKLWTIDKMFWGFSDNDDIRELNFNNYIKMYNESRYPQHRIINAHYNPYTDRWSCK